MAGAWRMMAQQEIAVVSTLDVISVIRSARAYHSNDKLDKVHPLLEGGARLLLDLLPQCLILDGLRVTCAANPRTRSYMCHEDACSQKTRIDYAFRKRQLGSQVAKQTASSLAYQEPARPCPHQQLFERERLDRVMRNPRSARPRR